MSPIVGFCAEYVWVFDMKSWVAAAVALVVDV
jgi:hypothetical protein